jgi:hypothetical protein
MSRAGWALLSTLAMGGTGCATSRGFEPIGALTLRVAPDQETDVVWVIKAEGSGSSVTETVLRCNNTAQGPVCVPAKVSQ